MKALSRDFNAKEKLLLLLLSLVLVGLAYYQFVDKPVREALATARAESDSLKVELKTVEAKLEIKRPIGVSKSLVWRVVIEVTVSIRSGISP